MSRSLSPDRGLIARMGLTMFLLGLLFVVLGSLLVYYLRASDWLILVVFLGAQWFFSDRLALYGMGGRIVTPEEAPELHGIVDRLCDRGHAEAQGRHCRHRHA
jgi:heat shock protein HtpX